MASFTEGDERLTFAFSLNAADAPLQVPPNTAPYMVHGLPAYILLPRSDPIATRAAVRLEIGWHEAARAIACGWTTPDSRARRAAIGPDRR
jgi:hypothetical protein